VTEETLRIGDSVLALHDGDEVPGVVDEIDGDRVLVTLAAPYLAAKGEPQTEVWCPISDVKRIRDDAGSAPELPS